MGKGIEWLQEEQVALRTRSPGRRAHQSVTTAACNEWNINFNADRGSKEDKLLGEVLQEAVQYA
jgi:hypothetical protein